MVLQMIHSLKIQSTHFQRVLSGTKTFEIRNNDRFFQKDDHVVLNEVEQQGPCLQYTGRYLFFKIGDVYVIDNERVVFSLLKEDQNEVQQVKDEKCQSNP